MCCVSVFVVGALLNTGPDEDPCATGPRADLYLGLADDGQAAPLQGQEGLKGFVACAAGACEVVRNGWTALGQRRGLQGTGSPGGGCKGQQEEDEVGGRLQASDSKRAT